MTTQQLAERYSRCFERATRPDGSSFVRLREDETLPEDAQELAHAGHRPDGLLPDDFRYEMIENAVDACAESTDEDCEDAEDYLPEAPMYNAERLQWLASHSCRVGYADDWWESYGSRDFGILDACAGGWLDEQRATLDAVRTWLKEHVQELTEAEEEAALVEA